ncbi:MAG: hypothetical protein ACO39T_08995, partial [Flavobacteriaceae bacterium]
MTGEFIKKKHERQINNLKTMYLLVQVRIFFNKTKTLLRSNNIYTSIEKIRELQPIKKSDLFNHIQSEIADELIQNDILVT